MSFFNNNESVLFTARKRSKEQTEGIARVLLEATKEFSRREKSGNTQFNLRR